MDSVNSEPDNNGELKMENVKIDIIRTEVSKIQKDVSAITFEISEIKNNLVIISEMMAKVATSQNRSEIVTKKNYDVFAKFVEESLESLVDKQAEAVVLEIVEILHKYKTTSDSRK